MRTRRVVWLFVLAVAACGGEPEEVTLTWGAIRSFPEHAEDIDRADKAAKLMMTRLFARLQESVSEGGPAKAVEVCRDAAPAIAREVGGETGLRLGRMSHRLRNPRNAPPEWAADFLKVSVTEGAPDQGWQPVAFFGPDGLGGLVIPIITKPMCVTCHGKDDEIPNEVKAALRDAYPDDRARGFGPGSLRGFLWVEWSTR